MSLPGPSASLTEDFISENPEVARQGYEWVYPEGDSDPAKDIDDFTQDNLLAVHKALSLPFTESSRTPKDRVRMSLFYRHHNLRRDIAKQPIIEPYSPVNMEDLVSLETEKPTEIAVEDIEQREYIKKMLPAALPREQCALILRFALNLSSNEIADILGVEPNYAKQIVFRGLRHMRKSTAGQEFHSAYLNSSACH